MRIEIGIKYGFKGNVVCINARSRSSSDMVTFYSHETNRISFASEYGGNADSMGKSLYFERIMRDVSRKD